MKFDFLTQKLDFCENVLDFPCKTFNFPNKIPDIVNERSAVKIPLNVIITRSL